MPLYYFPIRDICIVNMARARKALLLIKNKRYSMEYTASNQLAASAGSTPKAMYSFFMLGLCRDFYGSLGVDDKDVIRNRAAGIISFLPDPALRAKLWNQYEQLSLTDTPTTAAVIVIGQVIDVMAEVLEWSDTAVGSYL